METFYQVLVAIIGSVVGIVVYVLIEGKRKAKTKAKSAQEAEIMLDDVSYIQEIKQLYGKVGIAFLSIAGHSRTLNDSVKIVWYNQTRALRVFTHINDDVLITKYVETLVRRTFGTKDAMKLAKPVTKE